MRIDPVAQTATLTSLAFFLSSGLGGVSSARSYSQDIGDPEQSMMKPWRNPCGDPLGSTLKRSPQRHSVHRSLKHVRTQLRVAQNHFKKELSGIHKIYSKVYKVFEGRYDMSWLPKNQFEWYYKDLWCLEKGKKAEYALPVLHDALQKFAITFYSLRRFKSGIENNNEIIQKRNDIIKGMQNVVLRTLCEVKTAILDLEHRVPKIHNVTIVTNNTHWAKEGDLTVMLVQDSGVLRLYYAFLKDWTRAFRNATARGPGTCDPNEVKPLIMWPKQKKRKNMTRLNSKRPTQKKQIPSQKKQTKKKSGGQTNGQTLHARRRKSRKRIMRKGQRVVV